MAGVVVGSCGNFAIVAKKGRLALGREGLRRLKVVCASYSATQAVSCMCLVNQYLERGASNLGLRKENSMAEKLRSHQLLNHIAVYVAGRMKHSSLGGTLAVAKQCLSTASEHVVILLGGAYILTQKVDQISKELPMIDVLSALNSLCLLIRTKNSPHELAEMDNKIRNEFESEFSTLARLLPNIEVLFPHLTRPRSQDMKTVQIMNSQNITFTLQRFTRIVSNEQMPIICFFDDLQWGGSTSLKLIQTLLSDTMGSYFFFVGSYQDNEVTQDHPIFSLMSDLDSCGVTSTNIILCGLSKDYLNLMLAESLCALPFLCKSLSDIVHDRTKGNPLFALQFVKSLVDSRLLKYSLRQRRWIWDEYKIQAENATENVLHLLTAKIASLSVDTQNALKVVSCFGITTYVTTVASLSLTSQYSGLMNNLDQAINEGCMQKFDSDYKFVRDKAREAAYSLIPENERKRVSTHLIVTILRYLPVPFPHSLVNHVYSSITI